MRNELPHFMIGSSYGGNQDWFRTLWMRMGGCAAETACDSCLYFALYRGLSDLYPYDISCLTKTDYVNFAHRMEKYLRPRFSGIDRLEIFADGFMAYTRDRSVSSIGLDLLPGNESYTAAAAAVRGQIDAGIPIPTLVLQHKDDRFEDYVWHWFLINGYEMPEPDLPENAMRVKAVTYSHYEWLDLRALWNTGFQRRGGLILYSFH